MSDLQEPNEATATFHAVTEFYNEAASFQTFNEKMLQLMERDAYLKHLITQVQQSMPDPVDPTQFAATNHNHDGVYQKHVPGVVFLWPGTAPPAGAIELDGAELDRTAYEDIYAIPSLRGGDGDGVNTFNILDARAEFPRFWDHGRGVDVGRVLGSGQSQSTQEHRHGIGGTGASGSGGAGEGSDADAKWNEGAHVAKRTGTTLYGTSGDTYPRNIAFMACVWV